MKKKCTGKTRTEERYWTRVRDEDPPEGRHAREGASCARQSGEGRPRGSGPSMGCEDVLQFPRSYKSLSNNGVSSRW